MTLDDIKMLNLAKPGSHKGQNGRLLIIGGSHLFHAASIWALEVASRIVDLVHYSSIVENNALVKAKFRNGIVIARENIESYIEEDDCILIGPGMTRDEDTAKLTHSLLTSYPNKQWVIDAGALQMMDLADIPNNAILTPHHQEFVHTFGHQEVDAVANTYHCIVLLKGPKDIVSDGAHTQVIEGGNAGMTKGGTGDVLAGLIAALACKNDPFLATIAGSFINKKAGDELYASVGPFFNASDLAAQIPKTMKALLY